MRSVGGLHAEMLRRENLLGAVQRAAAGRRDRPEVRAYLARLDEELDALHDQLAAGEPRCGECVRFTVYDPKEREITAPVFRERVLHQAVMAVCGPVLERRLIHHTYACRKGKGTFAALAAAQKAAARAPWFVKLDVRKYFASIPHDRLFAALARVFREAPVRRLLGALVTSYQPAGAGRGLAIGTLVSQHLANFYLTRLDTVALQELGPAGYVRYMDDLAVWTPDRAAARAARDRLTAFAAAELGLVFKPADINRTARGMDFLGHRVFPGYVGLNRASRRRFRQGIRALHGHWCRGGLTEMEAQERATAMTAFTLHARCAAWRRRVLDDLGDGPQAGTACSAAAAGSTTARTPGPPTATATPPATRTTTSGSGPAPAPAAGRSALMEPAGLPASPQRAADKTTTTRRWPVADGRESAPRERERRVSDFLP